MMAKHRPLVFVFFMLPLLLLVNNSIHSTLALRNDQLPSTHASVIAQKKKSKASSSFLSKLPPAAGSLDDLEKEVSIQDIDAILNEITGTTGGNIIRPFQPGRLWLLTRWSGTVLKEVFPTVLWNMFATLVICIAIRTITGGSWAIGLKPDQNSHVLIARLQVFVKVWHYLMTLTTFTLTFFVGEAFHCWKDVYNMGRSIQGRMGDISLLLATHAARERRTGQYTEEAVQLLEQMGHYMRAFHVLHWASCARQYRPLLTRTGLEQMVARGIVTRDELDAIDQMDLGPTQKQTAYMEWMMMAVSKGIQDKNQLVGANFGGLQSMFLEKFCTLRGSYGGIGSRLAGRMPLAYAHLVQLLVDLFLLCAPLALYAELGAFSVISVGLLTLFYVGLLDLAKVFLDPLDNEDYCQGSVKIDLGVLMREANAGSTLWKRGAQVLPNQDPILSSRSFRN